MSLGHFAECEWLNEVVVSAAVVLACRIYTRVRRPLVKTVDVGDALVGLWLAYG